MLLDPVDAGGAAAADGSGESAAVDDAGDELAEPGDVLDPDRGVDDDTWDRIIATFHGGGLEPPDDEHTSGQLGQPEQSGTTRPDSSLVVPVRAWPESEDVDPDDDEPLLRRTVAAASTRTDDEERYVPPPPPELPMADSTTRLAWAGVVGGPLLFILALLLDWDLASWAQLAGVAGLVVGFVTLVARMRDDSVDDDPDNGAVV